MVEEWVVCFVVAWVECLFSTADMTGMARSANTLRSLSTVKLSKDKGGRPCPRGMFHVEVPVAVFFVVMLVLIAIAFFALHRQSLQFVFDEERRKLILESWRRRRLKK